MIGLRSADDPRDRSWMADAACRGASTDLFFPGRGEMGGNGEDPVGDAVRAICRGCPVRAACLEYALGVPGVDGTAEHFGVWGGLSERQRRSVRVQRRREQAVLALVGEIERLRAMAPTQEGDAGHGH